MPEFSDFKPSYFLEVLAGVTEEEGQQLVEALSLKNRAAVMEKMGVPKDQVLAIQRLHDAQMKMKDSMDFMKVISGMAKEQKPLEFLNSQIGLLEDFVCKSDNLTSSYRQLVYALKNMKSQLDT